MFAQFFDADDRARFGHDTGFLRVNKLGSCALIVANAKAPKEQSNEQDQQSCQR
jgi:hypothetical protein